jgi:hypothetical protein
MCTVSYLPFGETGFILTHNRDEKSTRPIASPPITITIDGEPVVFPQDPQGLGTWMAGSPQRAVCLLNGAFADHRSQHVYQNFQPRQSRGLVVLHSFQYQTVDEFIAQYDFAGIEPFTLLLAEAGRLTELRWNGRQRVIFRKAPHRPHIWSSVTLYPAPVVAQREIWFRDWLGQTPDRSPDAVRAFHRSAGADNPENALLMNRQNQYLTVSLTQIVQTGTGSGFRYEDLLRQSIITQTNVTNHATV